MLSEHQLLLHFTQNFMGYVGIELKPAPLLQSLDAVHVLPGYPIPGHHQALQMSTLLCKAQPLLPAVCVVLSC